MTRYLQLILSPHYGVVHEMSSESCAASCSGAEKADPSPPRGVRSLTVSSEESVIRMSTVHPAPDRRPTSLAIGFAKSGSPSVWLRTTTETKTHSYTRRTGIRHALKCAYFMPESAIRRFCKPLVTSVVTPSGFRSVIVL